jgi:cell division protease FtsH
MDRLREFFKRHRQWLFALLGLLLIAGFYLLNSFKTETPEKSLSEARQLIAAKQVQEAILYETPHTMDLRTAEGTFTTTFLAEAGDELVTQLNDTGTPYQVKEDRPSGTAQSWAYSLFAVLFVPAVLIGFLLYTMRGSGMTNPLSKQDYSAERPKERFADVKGAEEAVASLGTLVSFLKNPEKYKGIKVARGVLLHGPPGSGKTLIAKAAAGEAGCKFYYLAGAELGSVFHHGTGLQIKGMFERMRKKLSPTDPVIVYIDELDGIASKRAGEMMGDRDANSAVTQLLHQISLFLEYFPYGVLIAGSNRKDTIDEAVIRSQRLGLHIAMPSPDESAREEILVTNCAEMNVQGVNFRDVAKLTASMSGASVADIPHMAATAVVSRGDDEPVITRRDIEQAAMQVVFGTLRRSAYMPASDQEVAAVHESGHSIVAHASPYHRLLIVTTYMIAESGGSTWAPPTEQMVITREILLWYMACSLGSREAELMDIGTISTGAAHDIETATRLAERAVCEWGIIDGFVTRVDIDKWEDYPQSAEIGAAIQQLMDEASDLARKVLTEHSDLRLRLQKELRERRILHSDELEALTTGGKAA